jgi:DNA-binding NtrC family response regulator
MKTNPVEALDAFRAHPTDFDLLVTDLTMPQLTGAQLATELLKLRPGLPIILTTGFGGSMNAASARELGISEILAKPATADALTCAAHRVLSHGR